MTEEYREKQIIRVSITGIAANVVLAAFKAVVGILSHSIAIVLDAVNNLSDALSSVITVIGAKLAVKPADKEHPYGHGRYEFLSAAVISVIILYAGFTALIESVKKVMEPVLPDYSIPSLVIVATAVLVKIILGRYVKAKGISLNSDSLRNSGQDALLDAVISFATLIAAVIYLIRGISLEAWLGIIISVYIIKSGIDMIRETVSKLLGERVESDLATAVKDTISETPGVFGAYDLILNSYGPDRWQGSVHIEVPEDWTAREIDAVSREITAKVAEEQRVFLTAIGIYSRNYSDEAVQKIRAGIMEAVMKEKHVLQMHGFYCDTEKKAIRFDLVVDFQAGDRRKVVERFERIVKDMYPDYTITIILDTDFSD